MRRVALVLVLITAAACRPTRSVDRVEPTATTQAPATSSTTAVTAVTAPIGAGCDVPAGYPEPWADRPGYIAHLTVEPAERLVTGHVAFFFVPDADTDRLVLRLWPNAPRIGRAGGRLDITASQIAGQSVAGRYEPGGAAAGKPGTVWVLPGQFPRGQRVSGRLDFRLTVPGAINDRVATVGRAVRLGSVIPTLSWIRGDGWQTSPATHLNAEAAAGEVADWDVTVSAPAGYTTLATSTGLGGTPLDEGSGLPTTRFVARAVRDWAATVAPMRLGEASAQGGKTTVVVGVAEGAAGDPNALAARNAKALDDLAARFGEYPYPRLTIAVTTGLTGGIEFPTHIFLGSGVATVHLVHEVAHQWFYALVGNDQFRDPWLDEGFAHYGQSRVDGQLAYQRSRALPAYGRGHLGESMAYWGRSDGATYYLSVYVGGAQALAKLGDQLGAYDRLDCAIRRYVRDRAYTVSRP
ncbi:MAG TPA: M1 family aminopeptidase, partial [Acidimicrobiia bacterium]|nr:M1 family aminopeptidase [Acidimicrobiia bacterium]